MKEAHKMSMHNRPIRRQLLPALCGWLLGVTVLLLAVPAASQTLTVGLVCGPPGASLWFSVTLDPQDRSIAAIQNDISFDSTHTPIGTCTIADGLNKSLSWTYLPNGCSGTGCNGVRDIIFSMSDSSALGYGAVYQCRVDIPANTPSGTYPLTVSNPAASDPLGNAQPVTGVNGTVYVTTGSCGC